jgi:transcriptional regulator with XRE-family HTH domain
VAADPTAERAREQGARIKAIRERQEAGRAQIAARLGFSTSQTYDLYERGTSVIRLDRVEDWSAAFGLTNEEFFAELGLIPAARVILPKRLRGHIPERDIEQLVDDHADAEPASLHAIADEALRMAEQVRTERTPPAMRDAQSA